MGGWPHEEDGAGGDEKGERIDGEGCSGAHRCHERSSQRRSGEPERDRAHELVERVGGCQVAGGHEVGDDRLESGREERCADAVERDEENELPEREQPRERQDRERREHECPPQVGAEHQRPPVQPVAEDAGRQEEGDCRDGHAEAEQRESRRRVPELVGLPGHCDEENPVADQGDRHPGPEEAEVSVAQRGEEIDSGEAAGAIERLVAMLHATEARRPSGPR
jgi:hypothetical protein